MEDRAATCPAGSKCKCRGGLPCWCFALTHADACLPPPPTPQELAKERFDPEQLLSVFRKGRPTWLHELTADARGRRLILDLSAQHKSSIFLNYAIRRIFDTVRDGGCACVWQR